MAKTPIKKPVAAQPGAETGKAPPAKPPVKLGGMRVGKARVTKDPAEKKQEKNRKAAKSRWEAKL
jgi:hypothetical protein